MVVSIHQPAYLPWLGYLARIAASDTFIFLDTVQFEKNSFTNRNRIKTANGPQWLTVPVYQRGHMSKPITEIVIDNGRDWRGKHLRATEQNYRRAPRFAMAFPRLVQILNRSDVLLADYCHAQLLFWLHEFSIATKVVRASQLAVQGAKSDLVLALCRAVGATTYLSGPLGRGYLREGDFQGAGVKLVYHEYIHPVYPQLHGDFIPALSALDYWMNVDSLNFGDLP